MKTTTTTSTTRNSLKIRTAVRAGVSLNGPVDASVTAVRSRNFTIAAEAQAT